MRRTYTSRSSRRNDMYARAHAASTLARSRAIQKRRTSYVPRAIPTERKYFDTFLSAKALVASTDWTATECDPATLNTLFAPTEGSGINNRVGRKVNVLKISLRCSIRVPSQTNQTGADGASSIRMIIFMDQQTNGAQCQGEDLMSAPGTANAYLAPLTFQSTANFGRFRVLKDTTLLLQDPNSVYDGTNIEQNGLIRNFKLTINFRRPIPVRFNATNGGTVADIIDNSFHLIASASNVADLAPLLYYQVRTVYADA